MSRTFSLGCSECEVEIWIGQRSAGGNPYLYTNAETLQVLQEFLFSHQRHPLEFYDDEGSDYKILNMNEESPPPADS